MRVSKKAKQTCSRVCVQMQPQWILFTAWEVERREEGEKVCVQGREGAGEVVYMVVCVLYEEKR